MRRPYRSNDGPVTNTGHHLGRMTRHTHRDRRRRSVRLPGYDYASAGMYFVTICAHERECLFGEVQDGLVRLSSVGEVVASAWRSMTEHIAMASLDAWVVMPDHLHGIVALAGTPPSRRVALAAWRATHVTPRAQVRHRKCPAGPPARSLGAIIGSFKSVTTKRINVLRGTPGLPVWQRGYHEHVIGNAAALSTIRQYIAENPLRWTLRAGRQTALPS